MKRLKTAIKKMVAIGMGVAVLGATIGGVLADTTVDSTAEVDGVKLDLSNYPGPFVVDNALDDSTTIVIGEEAAASDTLGAIDIAANLQFMSTKVISKKNVEGPTTDIVYSNGDLSENILINGNLNSFGNLDHDDFSILWDGDLPNQFDGENIKTRETMIFDSTKSRVVSSGISDNDLDSDLALEMEKNGIVIKYEFKDSFDTDNFDDENLKIIFQGKAMEITDIDSNGMDLMIGKPFYLDQGDVITIDGTDMTLSKIGRDSVVVEIEGYNPEIISKGDSKTINGLEIFVDEIFYDEIATERQAFLTVGSNVEISIDDADDSGEIFNTEDYVWDFDKININIDDELVAGSYFTLSYDLNLDDEEEMIKVGEQIVFPNGVPLTFKSVSRPSSVEYSGETETVDSVDYYYLSGNEDDSFQYGTDYTRKIYLNEFGVFDEDMVEIANSTTTINLGDTEATLLSDSTGVTIFDGETMLLDWKNKDFVYNGDATEDRKEVIRTVRGSTFDNPEGFEDDGDINFEIYDKPLKAKFTIGGKAIETCEDDCDDETTTTEVVTESEISIPMISVVLDSEMTSASAKNLILVGGPVVNSVTAQFLGKDWSLESGQGLIQLFENGDKIAMVVAGTDKEDTRMAAKVIANYKDMDLEGTKVII